MLARPQEFEEMSLSRENLPPENVVQLPPSNEADLMRRPDVPHSSQEIDDAAQWLAAIVESSDDAILSKDLNGTITSWNRGAERIFGYTAEEAIGKPVTMLMPPERVNEEPDILARIRRGERIDHYETVRRRKDGRLLDISLTVSPITDGHGKTIGD